VSAEGLARKAASSGGNGLLDGAETESEEVIPSGATGFDAGRAAAGGETFQPAGIKPA
jgi:hypothetical protein